MPVRRLGNGMRAPEFAVPRMGYRIVNGPSRASLARSGTRLDGLTPSRGKPKSWHIPEAGHVGQKGVAMTNTTEVIPAPSARPFRAKYLVFAAVAAMAAYVLYHNERFLIDPAHPVWNHYDPFKWWLLPHGIAGLCALVLAPLQFAEGLRRRHTALHRTT